MSIEITLPDGSKKSIDSGMTGAAFAATIGRKLAEAALAVEVDGVLRDLSFKLEAPATVRFVTFDSTEGRELFWHSSSHLLAEALEALYRLKARAKDIEQT